MYSIIVDYHLKRIVQLSTVCSKWRAVAIGAPSLWGTISSRTTKDAIDLALERSKGAPISAWLMSSGDTTDLDGEERHLESMRSYRFLELVHPHMSQCRVVSFENVKALETSRMFTERGVRLSDYLERMIITRNESPLPDDSIIPFFSVAGRLLELHLQNLAVSRDDILRIFSNSPKLKSLRLESLLVPASEQSRETTAFSDPEQAHSNSPDIYLPCITTLKLRRLPSSLLYPIVKNIGMSGLRNVDILHDTSAAGNDLENSNETTSSIGLDMLVSRLITTSKWFRMKLLPSGLSIKPLTSKPACIYVVELIGSQSRLLPWLRLRSFPQATDAYRLELSLADDSMGEAPEQAVIYNLVRFQKVRSVVLRGRRESWRWIWMLSLPDAVTADGLDAEDGPAGTKKSWLWPQLKYLNFFGDIVDEFTTLSMLSARYGTQRKKSEGTGESGGEVVLDRLVSLEVHPGSREWRPEVLDRIREIVGPGIFRWQKS
ncbi:hypothetical protein FRB90_001891 [Tulasnella sp. 427]|nr:hypothetical protein FRB90_001891 [Tulasnella sp. 427]